MRRARAGAGLQVIGLAALLVRLSLWLGLLSHRRRQGSDGDPASHALPVQARAALAAAVPTRRPSWLEAATIWRSCQFHVGARLAVWSLLSAGGCASQIAGALLRPARTVLTPCASARIACGRRLFTWAPAALRRCC